MTGNVFSTQKLTLILPAHIFKKYTDVRNADTVNAIKHGKWRDKNDS